MNNLKKSVVSSLLFFSTIASALEIPTLPTLPSPGSGEVAYVVRNVSKKVDVKILDYWTNKDIMRKPIKQVHSQSVFSTAGSRWMTSFITLSAQADMSYEEYTIATVAGKKDFADVTYYNTKVAGIEKDFDAILNFVDAKSTIPSHKKVSHTHGFAVFLESYKNGSGDVIVICVADDKTIEQCQTQN